MSVQGTQSALCEILQRTVIPQVMRTGMSHIAVARSAWEAGRELPEGMTMSRTDTKGHRVKLRGNRPYGTTSLFDSLWPKDHLHSARAPVLCFIVKGPVAYQIANYVLHCEAGHGILMPPGVPFADGHHQFLDGTKMHQGSCAMLQMQPYHEGLFCWRTHFWLDAQKYLQVNEQNCSVHGSQVPGYLYQLMEEMQQPQLHQEMICNSLLLLLLGTLHRELQSLPVFESGELFPSPDSAKARHFIVRIEEYIRQNLSRNLTIEKMAHHACMSRTAFTQQFRARTGKSLGQYVADLRFEEACKLLQGTDLAVGQIANAVGFESNRLRVLFRQRKGISPSDYRRNFRKQSSK